MNSFMFIQYRISALFLYAFFCNLMPVRHKKIEVIPVLVVSYTVTTLIDAAFFFGGVSYEYMIVYTILQSFLTQLTAFWVAEYRDCRALFVGMSAATFVLPGNIVSSIIMAQWRTSVIALVVQVLIHAVLLIYLNFRLRDTLHKQLSFRKEGWSYLCAIPALFYMSVFSIVEYPTSIYDVESNMSGAIVILLLMIFVYIIIFRMLTKERTNRMLARRNEMFENYTKCMKKETESLQMAEEKMRFCVMILNIIRGLSVRILKQKNIPNWIHWLRN